MGCLMSVSIMGAQNEPSRRTRVGEGKEPEGVQGILAAAEARPVPVRYFFCAASLDHGDMAYEWQFAGIDDYAKMEFSREADYHIRRTMVKGSLMPG